MKLLNSIVFAGLLIFASQSSAETLTDAWAMALSSHGQIAAATAEREAAGFELERAKSARLPQLGITSAYTQLDKAPGFSFGDGMSTGPIFEGDSFLQAGAQVSVPLYAGGAINSGIDAAESGTRAAEAQLATVIQSIKLGVAEHYVGVLRAESAVDVAESNVATLKAHTDDTRNRFDLGAVPQNDFLAASVTHANARQRLLQAENALDFARAGYNRLLGRSLIARVSLDPAVDVDRLVPSGLGLEDLIMLAQSERQELKTMASQAVALHRQSDTVRAQARPQLELTGGYMFLENAFLTDDQFWVAGVSLKWNLFDGGQSRKRSASLDRKAMSVSHSRSDLETLVALQVRRAWNDRFEAGNRLVVAESTVAQSEENLRVVSNRYNAGASTNADVLDAESLREHSLSNRDDARFEVVLAKLRLARAVGSL